MHDNTKINIPINNNSFVLNSLPFAPDILDEEGLFNLDFPLILYPFFSYFFGFSLLISKYSTVISYSFLSSFSF